VSGRDSSGSIAAYITNGTDCNDNVAAINPGATEVCDGIDNNCDGATDDFTATGASNWYPDADADGYGEKEGTVVLTCYQPSGYVADNTDCDDTAATIYPGASESCNGVDDNCDIAVDENAVDAGTWYADTDGDSYGDLSTFTVSCDAPVGYVGDSEDCDDTDNTVHPGATETCNNIDDNCDGVADATTSWYQDADGDGYGNPGVTQASCAQPSGYVADNTDCDDTNAAINPGATEIWYNSVDERCDGGNEFDQDGDGYDMADGYGHGNDPDDMDATVYPGADELCDGQDNDGDGNTDNDCFYVSGLYRVSDFYKNWADARTACMDLSGGGVYDLVAFNDAAEATTVSAAAQALLPGEELWVGYNDMAVEGSWSWIGSTSSYVPSFTEDGGAVEDCGVMANYGPYIADRSCTDTYTFVCEPVN